MNFDKFSPPVLRAAIEKELRSMDFPDVKTAAVTALNNLKDNPDYYSAMEKARPTKYIRRTPKMGGGWNYIYKEDQKKEKQPEKNDEKEIKLRMIFDSQELFFNYKLIGFEERVGYEKTSEQSLKKAQEVEGGITNFEKEYISVIDKNGNILFSKNGNYDEINFNEIEIKKLRNSEILTHTHPEDKSFSVEDVFLALSLGIKELRVKTPENIYSFKISHKKNIDSDELISNNKTFMNVIAGLNKEVLSIMRQKVKEREITVKEAQKEHREMFWNMVQESPVLLEDFNIEYKKVTK